MVLSNSQWLANPGVTYEIDQSIRFNDDDSAFLARTPSASNRKTWTWSAWVKRANLFNGSVPQILLSAGDGGSNDFIMQFGQSDNTLRISDYIGGTQSNLITTQLFGDVGAWYHFVLTYDTTQGTSGNRIKLFVNGSQVTSFGTETYPSENADLVINSAIAHNIGRGAYSSNGYFSGYMAEINFVDGTALAPTAFGETNTNGVWVPIAYAGSYGTEGYFIDGRDSSDLGDDESGNGNDFSTSGLAANDQMSDSPTNNYCVLNALQQDATGLSNGNLQFTTSSTSTHKMASATIAQTSGKWYCEVTCNATLGSNARIGIIPEDNDNYTGSDGHVGDDANSFAYVDNGKKESNNSQSSYGASYANGDVIAMALNLDDNEITFYKDGSSQGTISITANTEYRFAASQYNAGGMAFNFGQAAFAATPPTGFKALNTDNLATPTISDPSKYFQTTLYNGTGSELEVDQSGEESTFQPDFVWIKNRSNAGNENELYDAVRGATKAIFSSATSAESTQAQGLKSFDGDGFTVGTRGEVNTSGSTNVAWQWKESATAGFDIVTDTGTGSAHTISHSLGVTPEFIMRKDRTATSDPGWIVWHKDLGGANYYLNLHDTGAGDTSVNYWNNTLPTSSVFSVGSSNGTNQDTKTFVTYLFASIPSFSSIGSYEGNGNANGTFVYTGFSPSWLLIKNIDAAESWNLRDNKRDLFNVTKEILAPNTNAAEATSGGGQFADLLSNGFKLRGTDPGVNSAATFIYVAFAENPFGGDGIAPATAR